MHENGVSCVYEVFIELIIDNNNNDSDRETTTPIKLSALATYNAG